MKLLIYDFFFCEPHDFIRLKYFCGKKKLKVKVMISSNIRKRKMESVPDFGQALERAEQMLDGSNDVKVLLAQQLYQQDLNEERIKALENIFLCQKEIFNLDEAAMYIGVSKSNLYKMTASRKIPHYKPAGRYIYFERSELDKWIREGAVKTEEELSDEAIKYCYERASRV